MTATHAFILSVDYEVFGDGSGCVKECVIRPAERLLALADRFGAKVTLFVEALEFEKMEAAGIPDIKNVKDQLIKAYRAGHDIQLHIHPQWIYASKDQFGWNLDVAKWRVADLDQEQIANALMTGKRWLERVIRSEDSHYECVAFRAGAWCIQPSSRVLSVLKTIGIKVDSTVAPGAFNPGSGDWYDFRHCPQSPWWWTTEDVLKAEDSTEAAIMEVPIASGNVRAIGRLRTLMRSRYMNQSLARDCHGSYRGANTRLNAFRKKLAKLRNISHVMLDFCTLTCDEMMIVVGQHKEIDENKDLMVPIVAIGHTKNFSPDAEKNLCKFLGRLSLDSSVRCETMSGWLCCYKDWNESA